MLGYSAVASGFAVLPLSLAVFVTVNFFTGRLLGRWSHKPLLVTGLVLLGAGSALWMTTTEHSSYGLTMLPGLLVMGVGTGLTFPTMTAAALSGVAPERHSVAGAVNVTAQQIGASVGVAALVAASTAASDTPAGYHVAHLVTALACGAAAAGIAVSRLRAS
ncbi:MFS transporter [Streptomyces montanus]|uniref:MFS transporter n=1 Tax=Streptomyces montanus TaxID=2580423 RepID=A0A5R9FWK6_9ACTN|nr:MFS transporter [Streptomyces montanus]